MTEQFGYKTEFEKEKEKEWSTDVESHEECPHVIRKIVIAADLKYLIIHLCDKTEGEYFAYLLGSIKEDRVDVKDIYVPEQEAGWASVDVKEKASLPNVVGTIHKHPGQSNSSSHTDNEYQNYPVMIIVDSTGTDWKATSKNKTPCGAYIESEPEINFIIPKANKNVSDMLKKIKSKTYTVSQGEFFRPSYGGGYLDKFDKKESWKGCDNKINHEMCPYEKSGNGYTECECKDYNACAFYSYYCPYKYEDY